MSAKISNLMSRTHMSLVRTSVLRKSSVERCHVQFCSRKKNPRQEKLVSVVVNTAPAQK